jgi:hypothetical protein
MMESVVVLVGDRVSDPVSGLEGIVQARTQWLYGCVRITIQPDGSKDGKPFDCFVIDEPQAQIVKRATDEPAAPNHGDRDDATATQRP